ncbi:MAG: hypothetical protein HGB35_01045 [Geobacteraceae bacterium]|nr:hypothetical protein [Geobacteraceae bacterium]
MKAINEIQVTVKITSIPCAFIRMFIGTALLKTAAFVGGFKVLKVESIMREANKDVG